MDKVALLREKFKKEENEKQEKFKYRGPRKEFNMMTMSDVKSTTAAILREEALLRKKRKEQQEMIAAAEMGLQDVEEFEAWKERLKIKEQEEKIVDLERKRLEVQLLHEETFLARKELIQDNKYALLMPWKTISDAILLKFIREKVAEIIAEKKEIKQYGEELKKEIELENQRKIEDVHAIKEGAVKAKESVIKGKAKNGTMYSSFSGYFYWRNLKCSRLDPQREAENSKTNQAATEGRAREKSSTDSTNSSNRVGSKQDASQGYRLDGIIRIGSIRRNVCSRGMESIFNLSNNQTSFNTYSCKSD